MNEKMPTVEERQINAPKVDVILNLEEMIKNCVSTIQQLKEELKKNREMLTDSFTNDPTYQEKDQSLKQAARSRSQVKLEISKQPSVAKLDQKVKDLRFDINEKKKTLSDLLIDYKQQTGATQLQLFNDEVVDIVETAKIVRKK